MPETLIAQGTVAGAASVGEPTDQSTAGRLQAADPAAVIVSTPRPDAVEPLAARDLSAPELYLNRELTWLTFNSRVLAEAQDPRNPLLERVKFLAITASNL